MATGQGDSFRGWRNAAGTGPDFGGRMGLFLPPSPSRSSHIPGTKPAANPALTLLCFPHAFSVTELLPGRLHPTPSPLLVLRS